MAKFRKKVEEFIAHQWLGEGHSVPGIEAVYDKTTDKNTYFVTTAHKQRVYLSPGDWVHAEPNGDGYYPIKDSIMKEIAVEVQD